MMRNYNGSNNGTLYIYIYLLINPFHHRRFERIRQKISETWNKTRGDFPPGNPSVTERDKSLPSTLGWQSA